MRNSRLTTVALSLLLAVLAAFVTAGPAASVASARPADQGAWETDPTFTLTYVGREDVSETDRYEVGASWGATFFGMAVEAMPLEPADEATRVLLDAFAAAYPSRAQADIRPGDRFEFRMPVGTFVAAQSRTIDVAREFRSFNGDHLVMYTKYDSPLEYRLVRADSPHLAEAKIRRYPTPDTYLLAQALYGKGDLEFKPDFLQIVRAMSLNLAETQLITIDTRRDHLDDLRQLTGNRDPDSSTEGGLDVYWIRPTETAQPTFRVDDGIRNSIDFSAVPRVMRVYYYKNGVVRTYQRSGDSLFLSGRQPSSSEWARAFEDYGRANLTPVLWGIGQPEEGPAAQELRDLGITVLRFNPKEEPPGNIFTSFIETLLSFIRRSG